MRYGQISVEYLIILGAVLFFIIIPAGILLTDFTLSSIYSTVDRQQANELGEGLTDMAKEVYYLGLYSKKQVVLPIPDNVQRLQLLNISDGSDNHYIVLHVNSSRPERYIYPSRAPLTANLSHPDISTANPTDIDECDNTSCSAIEFHNTTVAPGKRRFQAQSILEDGNIIVKIKPVIS